MTVSRNNQVLQLLNCRMRVILCDNRTFIGTFIAYDSHMNLVLSDTVEYKRYKPKRKPAVEGKKTIGVAIIRGENIMSIIVDAPPPEQPSSSRYERERERSSRH